MIEGAHAGGNGRICGLGGQQRPKTGAEEPPTRGRRKGGESARGRGRQRSMWSKSDRRESGAPLQEGSGRKHRARDDARRTRERSGGDRGRTRKESSRQTRAKRFAWTINPHRSWLKLCMMHLKPWFSAPMRFSTGT